MLLVSLTVMRLFQLRTGAAIAALVILQAPVMLAVNGEATPAKQARIDRQIEQIQQVGAIGTVSVIIRSDGSTDWASLLKALRTHGIKIGRIVPRTNAISLTISTSDLVWLQ